MSKYSTCVFCIARFKWSLHILYHYYFVAVTSKNPIFIFANYLLFWECSILRRHPTTIYHYYFVSIYLAKVSEIHCATRLSRVIFWISNQNCASHDLFLLYHHIVPSRSYNFFLYSIRKNSIQHLKCKRFAYILFLSLVAQIWWNLLILILICPRFILFLHLYYTTSSLFCQ